MNTYTLTWDNRGYKIYVNDELVSEEYVAGSYTFKKGDVIKIDNYSNVGEITINETAYTASANITLTDQDITVTGRMPSASQFTITIETATSASGGNTQ